MLIYRRGLVLTVCAYLLATAATVPGQGSPAASGRSVWDGVFTDAQAERGRGYFAEHCARCHGIDGRPTSEAPQARDLSDHRIVDLLSDEHIERTIRMGKPPTMPAFGNRFTEAALEVLVAHVRSLSGSRGPRAAEPDQKVR